MTTFDSLDILRVMPQRYPLLLVDGVEIAPDSNRCLAFKNITLNEPCYRYIAESAEHQALAYPLALLAESFGQGAGLLLMQRGLLDPTCQRSVVVFGEFGEIEIAGHAYPGDRLKHEIQIDFASSKMATLSGTTCVHDRLIASYRGVKVFRIASASLTPESCDA
jgi:3-hydroxymyristoyl/3-hydroxydecanoyl-(acyl carrier protein) dehydratase